MPLKISVAFSRKTGEPNYGSRGATVGLELEAETSLVQAPQEFERQMANLFWLARHAVEKELALPGPYGAAPREANGRASANRSADRPATARQVQAICAIAQREEIDLVAMLRERFNVEQPEALSVAQASQLIDAIKPRPAPDQPADEPAPAAG